MPTSEISREDLPCNILEVLTAKTGIFPSKGEARKMIQGNGLSINKDKMADPNYELSEKDILDDKYVLIQKGKKNYYIIKVK